MDFTDLNSLSKNIVEVYDPDVYSHNVDIIDKPMADIPFGHILNVNWDNIARCFGILQNYLYQAVYTDMVSQANIANTLVQRGADGGIQVGDIYTTTAIGDPLNTGDAIAFKSNGDSKIKYTTDYSKLREVIGISTSSSAGLDINADALPKEVSGTSGDIALSDASQNYNVILVQATSDYKWSGYYTPTIILTDSLTGNIEMNGHGLALTWNKLGKYIHYGSKDGGRGAYIFGVKGIA